MRELNVNEIEQINGGIPLFVAIAIYGEVASFAAMFTGMVTYNSLTN